MNHHAGMRFRMVIASAGKSSSGVAAIHGLLLGAALGGVEVEANVCSLIALAPIYRAAKRTTIGGPDPQGPPAIPRIATPDGTIALRA
jgi:hypothetical protein